MSHHVSLQWAGELKDARNDEDLIERLKQILSLSHLVPYGDLCATAAIVKLHDEKRFTTIVDALIELAPHNTQLQEGTVIELLTKDHKGIAFI